MPKFNDLDAYLGLTDEEELPPDDLAVPDAAYAPPDLSKIRAQRDQDLALTDIMQSIGGLGNALSGSNQAPDNSIFDSQRKAAIMRGSEAGQDAKLRQQGVMAAIKAKAQAARQAKDDDYRERKLKAIAGKGDAEKRLPPPTVLNVNEGAQLPKMLDDVSAELAAKKNLFGPVENMGESIPYFPVKNPYNTDKRALDAKLRLTSQMIGKFLEGGVLRKEDEEKYRKMLPVLTDTPEVAAEKIKILRGVLNNRTGSDVGTLKAQGYKTEGLPTPERIAASAPKAAVQEGQTATNKKTGEKLVFKGGKWQPM